MAQGIAQLSAAMAVGDSDAVDAFYREYFDWMYGQARRVTRRDESFCLDVVQDAVLRVIRTVKPVEEEGRFRGWLQLVVKTTAFDLLRSERRRKNREAMAGMVTGQIEADVDSLQLDWLQDQINRLDPEIVKIIELRFEQQWTLRRIGERLGVSIGAVDGRLRRALTHLRLAAEELPIEPQNQPIEHEAAGTGAAAAIALDTILAERVDIVAPPVVEVIEPSVDAAAAASSQAELIHIDSPRDEPEKAPVTATLPAFPAEDSAAKAETESHDLSAISAREDVKAPEPVPVSEVPSTADATASELVGVESQQEQTEQTPVTATPASPLDFPAEDGDAGVAATGEPESHAPTVVIAHDEVIANEPQAEPSLIQPAIAARAVATDPSASLGQYAVAVDEPRAVEVMEYPELIGLEDEAGWYDDVL